MPRSRVVRSSFRRSGFPSATLVTGFTVNGTPIVLPADGVLDILSPMASIAGAALRIDNANYKLLADGANIGGIDASLNTIFEVTLGGNRSMDAPSNPQNGEKITFLIRQDGTGGRTLTWTAGAGAYRFANAASPQGVRVADFNTLLAAAPASGLIRIGFEYTATDDRWDAVALAGYWP